MLDDSFGCTAQQKMFQPGVTMRRHDNQIGRKFLREFADFIECGCACSQVRLFARGKCSLARDSFQRFSQLLGPLLLE